ncbi:hypothetical protein [Pseudoalteromonas luteoviolacea]|jgi:hypothetical protein|uniref:hypothetical protein n=1 Tax=Pseudoalteromonas luteoviolacea TaxID=43657 RepID=UPI001B35C344|nr:hypothetical protein [Pseudoalteromonas luteoviolacea]MBQ4840130.1 hypothetical protein [Pseudoalteromonas luteoviolacea]
MMDRKKVRLIVIQKDDSKWMQIHFCRYFQRAANIERADPDGLVLVSDVADLWFPVPVGTDLFEAIEFILTSHRVAHHLVHLEKVAEHKPLNATCNDWEATFSPLEPRRVGQKVAV